MPIASPYYGGKRRLIVAKLAESTWGTAAAYTGGSASVYVLNPLGDSGGLYPPGINLVDNSNSAQGQGERATKRQSHAQDHQGSYKFDLTPESLGVWSSCALGADAYSAVGTSGRQHIITQSTNVLFGRTLSEHMQTAADTTDAAKFTGCYPNSFSINVSPGNRFCTMDVDLVGSRYEAAADDSSYDVTANWPDIIGIPPTKISFQVAASQDYANPFSACSFPTAAGQEIDSITGTNYARYIKSLTFKYMNNINLDEQYAAGTGTSSGFYRGQAYPVDRQYEVTATLECDSSSAAFVRFEKDFVTNEASYQSGYALQLSGVSDSLIAGGTCYRGFSVIMPAATLARPTWDRGLGITTVQLTWTGMAPASGNFITIYTWDDYAKEYDATS